MTSHSFIIMLLLSLTILKLNGWLCSKIKRIYSGHQTMKLSPFIVWNTQLINFLLNTAFNNSQLLKNSSGPVKTFFQCTRMQFQPRRIITLLILLLPKHFFLCSPSVRQESAVYCISELKCLTFAHIWFNRDFSALELSPALIPLNENIKPQM